jgi:sarcosine oxidase subunit alpha
LAGRRFHPFRLTPIDAWHRQAGAKMVHVGAWFRPEYYASAGSSREDCILNEALAVRRSVGLIDLSTLGKLFVNGPEAVRFLEHVFTGSFGRQKIGTIRYAMACDETGIVHEEGIAARLADDRFYITASTAGADAFYRELQRWAIQFKMDVVLSNATGHWAAMNLAGPDARRVLAKLTDEDIGSNAIPFGAVREIFVAQTRALVLRAGFVGELSYEIHLPATQAPAVWTSLLEAGREFNIRPFGIEAQRLLRLEKGHLIVGHDTDALTTPCEAQLDWAVDMAKPFFVGKRAIEMLQRKPLQRKLVGIVFPAKLDQPIPEECQLVIENGQIAGRITSVAKHTTLGYPIGLAFVRPDMANPGRKVRIRVGNHRLVDAEVTGLPFYDREHARQSQ